MDRADAVVVRVRRADLREETAARLDVVVVARDTGVVEAAQLLAAQQAERGAEIDFERAFHLLERVDGAVEIFAAQHAARGHDGEAVGPGLLVCAGIFDDFLFRQEAVLLDARVVAGGLCAVFAVLAAASAAPVDDCAEIDVVTAEMLLQAAGSLLQEGEGRREQEGQVVLSAQAASREDFVHAAGEVLFYISHDDRLLCYAIWTKWFTIFMVTTIAGFQVFVNKMYPFG